MRNFKAVSGFWVIVIPAEAGIQNKNNWIPWPTPWASLGPAGRQLGQAASSAE